MFVFSVVYQLALNMQVALDLTEDEKHQLQNMVVEEGG